MSPEDVALYRADPDYAATLGIDPPTCTQCGGEIKDPPPDWDGKAPLRHLFAFVCRDSDFWQPEAPHEQTERGHG